MVVVMGSSSVSTTVYLPEILRLNKFKGQRYNKTHRVSTRTPPIVCRVGTRIGPAPPPPLELPILPEA
jgi:hypothetical protein